jgi:hypothetical protein
MLDRRESGHVAVEVVVEIVKAEWLSDRVVTN